MGKLSKLKDAVEGAITKLDMSHAARMDRARDMGFDTDKTYYHGTGNNFDSFKEGYGGAYFSDSPEYADRYTTRNGESGRNIIPVHLKRSNTFDTRKPEHKKIYNEQFLNKWGNGTPLKDDGLPDWVESHDFQEFFADSGLPFDSAVVGEPPTKMPDGSWRPESSVLVTNENNIRSVNAAFDPDKKDSANLLASLGGATVLGGAAMAPEEAEAGVVTKGGKKIIEAFHGSPHKFDKFSMSNIGTGEGAQAYGHGLYFADSEDVARQYREALGASYSIDGKPYWRNGKPVASYPDDNIDMYLGANRGDIDKAIDDLATDIDRLKRPESSARPETIAEYESSLDSLKMIRDEGRFERESRGAMYQVDIDATPDELLDWDLPLSEQSEAVKKAYAAYLDSDDAKDVARQWSRYKEGMGLDEAEPMLSITGDPSGNNLYRNAFKDREAANQYLTSAGIKGIKYKDGFSRGADGVEGTSNYVIFDDNIISIAKKYGVSLPVAGMIAAGATPQEAQASANSVGDFVQRRAAKKEYWNGLKDRVKRRGIGARNENAQQEAQQAMLEAAAAVNRGLADTVDFVGAQVPNAVLNLVGSDQRVNSIYDLPGVNQATEGNYMEDSPTKDAIRFGGEMLSPL